MKVTPQTAKSIGDRTSNRMLHYKPKSYIFPPGMVVLVDTREQLPLFDKQLPKGLVLCSHTLKDGDYSIGGHQDAFAIERKCLSDLIPYCTAEHAKTKAKMERFAKMEWVGLTVEARESEIYSPYTFSNTSPESIRQALVSFSIRYGVHVYIGSRDNITRWMLDRMIKYYKVKREL